MTGRGNRAGAAEVCVCVWGGRPEQGPGHRREGQGLGGAGGPGGDQRPRRVGWAAARWGEEGQVAALGKAAALRGGG